MRLSNTMYDKLKIFCTTILPAAGTLYFALSSIWHFPFGEQIIGTISAVTAFLGVCLKISSNNYNASMQENSENSDEM